MCSASRGGPRPSEAHRDCKLVKRDLLSFIQKSGVGAGSNCSSPVRPPWCSLFLLLSTDKKIEPITPEHNWGFLLYVEETILNCCKDRLESFQKHDPSCVRWNFFSGVNVRSRKRNYNRHPVCWSYFQLKHLLRKCDTSDKRKKRRTLI